MRVEVLDRAERDLSQQEEFSCDVSRRKHGLTESSKEGVHS